MKDKRAFAAKPVAAELASAVSWRHKCPGKCCAVVTQDFEQPHLQQ